MARKKAAQSTPDAGATEVAEAQEQKIPSTTERLFGPVEPTQQAPETPVAQPEPQPESAPSQASESSLPEAQEPEAEPQTAEDYLDIEAFGGKKVKLKVDGVERVVTLQDLTKEVQLKEHLDRAAKELGEQRRQWREEQKRNQERPSLSRPTPAAVESQDPIPSDPFIAQLIRKQAEIEAQIQHLQPVAHENARQRVAREIETESGFKDFADYLPKIEAAISVVKDPALVEFYDTPEGAKKLFYQIKARELSEAQKTAAPRPSPVRPTPPIQRIDGGRSVPSSTSSDTWDSKYRAAEKRWLSSNRKDRVAFNEMLQLKGAL